MSLRRKVYSVHLKHYGTDNEGTLQEADNLAEDLLDVGRSREAKSLLLKMIPVAQRVIGENNETTLRMRETYARVLYRDTDATLSDLREAVLTLEDVARISRRVMSGAHPITKGTEDELRAARAVLRARETPQEGA